MKTVKGIYAEAGIFTDDVEEYAQAQVKMICDNAVAEGSRIRLMPDIHPGKVGPIGLSMTVTDKIIPQLLGVDIGCGMTCVKVNKNNAEFQKLDRVIRENVPSGFAIRTEPHHMAAGFPYEKLRCARHINRQKAERSLGTLGGGNHFTELDRGEDGSLYLVVHTGSRHLGEEVAEYYTKLASMSLKERGLEVPYYMSWLEGEQKEKEMKGIYSSSVGADTLDEAPFAYRSLTEIAERIRDTVRITEILKPVYNYKAGSKEPPRNKS